MAVQIREAGVQLLNVTYHYPGSSKGVDAVSLSAQAGSVYGLLGANGAGKTTLMRLMTGLLEPSRGSVHCMGRDLKEHRRDLLASIGSMIEVPSIYHHLTGKEHLKVFALYTAAKPGAIDSVVELVGLTDARNTKVATYSLGMRQRLAIATALLHDPMVLILDEPTNGLDPMGIVAMRELLSGLARDRGKTVIVSSHILAEVEKIASHVGVIHAGRIRFEGPIGEVRASAKVGTFRIRVSSPADALRVLGTGSVCSANNGVSIQVDDDSDAASAIQQLVVAGIEVYEASSVSASLEEDFLRLIQSKTNAQ